MQFRSGLFTRDIRVSSTKANIMSVKKKKKLSCCLEHAEPRKDNMTMQVFCLSRSMSIMQTLLLKIVLSLC